MAALDWNSCTVNVSGQQVATLKCVGVVLVNVINFLVMFSGIVAVFFVVFAGYKYVTSQGDPAKLESARKTFFYAIVGLVLIALAFFFVNLVTILTGVHGSVIFNTNIGGNTTNTP